MRSEFRDLSGTDGLGSYKPKAKSQKPIAKSSGASFLGCKRQDRRVASYAGPRTLRLFWNANCARRVIFVRQLVGDPEPYVPDIDPAPNLLQHHELHHRVRSASGASAMFVESGHNRAIQALKFFRWMIDRANQCTGHFHPFRIAFPVAYSGSLYFMNSRSCHLLPTKVTGFAASANWQLLQWGRAGGRQENSYH